VAFRRCLLALALLALVLVIVYWPRKESPAPQLRALPDIPELNLASLPKVPPAELLALVERECTRRVLNSRQGPRSAPAVLSPSASAIWVIGTMEPVIVQYGFGSLVRFERDHALTPLFPTLTQAADAYAEMDLQPVGEIVRRAVALVASSDNEAVTPEACAELDKLYRGALGKGSQAIRVRYVQRHLATLFPVDTPTN
jgi:hypothetical protein